MATPTNTAGLILAGGHSSRMGQDKADLLWQGQSLLQHCCDQLAPQVDTLYISSNLERPEFSHYPRLTDPPEVEFAGPMAGILAGLRMLQKELHPCEWLQVVAVDTPFIPRDLCRRLTSSAQHRQLICARSQGRLHPTISLWHRNILPALEDFLVVRKQRKMMLFLQQIEYLAVDFDNQPFDPFFNINTPHDLKQARVLLDTSQ